MMFRADQTTGKNKTRATNKRFLLAVAMAICLSCTVQANTDMTELHHITIAKSSLEKTLKTLAKQTGVQLLFPFDLVTTLESKPLSGDYTVMDALDIVLKDTGLSGSLTSSGVITISPNGLNGKGKSMSINTKKSLLASMVALMVGGAGQQVAAQDEADFGNERSWLLEEVVVTAQKREQNIMDVPIAIAALGGEELKARGIDNLVGLSLAVPGLLVQDSGSISRRISIRGIGNVFGSSALVGLYIDDASVAALADQHLDVRA